MSELKLDLNLVAAEIVRQMKEHVPVHTGRLKDSIQFEIKEGENSYTISLIMEDYFKWLKPRTKTPRLPSPSELALARPPLPKMNDLGVVQVNELSTRSQGILDYIDLDVALSKLDRDKLIKQIHKLLEEK